MNNISTNNLTTPEAFRPRNNRGGFLKPGTPAFIEAIAAHKKEQTAQKAKARRDAAREAKGGTTRPRGDENEKRVAVIKIFTEGVKAGIDQEKLISQARAELDMTYANAYYYWSRVFMKAAKDGKIEGIGPDGKVVKVAAAPEKKAPTPRKSRAKATVEAAPPAAEEPVVEAEGSGEPTTTETPTE
jgi:hypothetical protein